MITIYSLLKYMQNNLGPEYLVEVRLDNDNLVFMLHSKQVSYSHSISEQEIKDASWNPCFAEYLMVMMCDDCRKLKERFNKGEK